MKHGPERRDHGDRRTPLLRADQPAHGLSGRRHATRRDGRARRHRAGVRSRGGDARGRGPPAPPLVALRATDLLVRCPGFTLVALDLGERPPRVPLTLAFRLRLAVRRTGTALLIMARRRIAGPGAALAVRTLRCALHWEGPGLTPTRLARVGTTVEVLRCRGGLGDVVPAARTWWGAA